MKGTPRAKEGGRADATRGIVTRAASAPVSARCPPTFLNSIGHLSGDLLSDLAEALLDFKTLSDAHIWLAKHRSLVNQGPSDERHSPRPAAPAPGFIR